MRELAAREEQRKTEWLEEELRRAQGQCAEDEKQMEERRIKVRNMPGKGGRCKEGSMPRSP